MPHRGAGWTSLRLCGLRRAALQLSFLRQPALSQVPGPANATMAGKTAWAPAALSLLSADVHAAFGVARFGTVPAKILLRVVAQHGSGQHPEALRGPQVVGGPTR